MYHQIRNNLSRVCCGILLAVCAVQPASAQLITFADFDFSSQSNTFPMQFTGENGLQTFDPNTNSLSVPIKFRFSIDNGYDYLRNGNTSGIFGQNIDAHMVLTSTANGDAAQFDFGSGNLIDFETLSNINITITADNPLGGFDVLMQVTNTTGGISGSHNGVVATLSSDSSAGDTVNFSSDFLSFNNSQTRTISLIANSLVDENQVTAPLALNGQHLRDFFSNGNGNFSADPTPLNPFNQTSAPEPASLAFICMGGVALVVRRRLV